MANSGDGLGVKRPHPVRQESAASQLSGSFLNDSDFGENELSSNPYRFVFICLFILNPTATLKDFAVSTFPVGLN